MNGPLDEGREESGGDDGQEWYGSPAGPESRLAGDRREAPRIPGPRTAADDHDDDPDTGPGAPVGEEAPPSHSVLKSLLGAWALAACSAGETEAVEAHLGECAPCAEEALRLRDAVSLLHTERDLDLDPLLRFRVLENCLGRRPARVPVPE
ncbi:hypothetical protein GCM10010232_03660 [Streptomyces amakusaensis]